MKKTSGFTLIEMLVVIGVILLLGAMMMPALNKAREAGRATVCISNLKQLHLAALNYANGGSVPASMSSRRQDEFGAWYEAKGWVSWHNYTAGSGTDGAYEQTSPNGIKCITNGTLYTYARSKDIYICPTFKISRPTYTRGYAMNASASGVSILSAKPTTLVLFGDDAGCTAAAADSQFGTNEVSKIHSGGKGHVVYLDGHIEKW